MLINSYVPFLKRMTDMVIGSRTIIAMCLFTLLFAMVYKYLPNHRNRAEKRKQKRLFPGAVLAAVGWLVISYVSSIYVEVFRGFSNMYGSLTMIILMMLWMYFCLYMLLLGGELNVYLESLDREE